jgi:hypothetical protein
LDSLSELHVRLEKLEALLGNPAAAGYLPGNLPARVGELRRSVKGATITFVRWAEGRDRDVDDLTRKVHEVVRQIGESNFLKMSYPEAAVAMEIIELSLADAVGRIVDLADEGRSFSATSGTASIADWSAGGSGAAKDVRKPRQQQKRGRPRPKRYANVELLDLGTGRRLHPSAPLTPNQRLLLRLNIGKLTKDSQVRRREAFPDDKLPKDVSIDVMVSSTDFAIELRGDDKTGAGTAHGRLFLPGDGGPARTPEGGTELAFVLLAPEAKGAARCRIGYYFRNILVQSQLLTAQVGEPGGFAIDTDFTLSEDLTGLHIIPERPRLSILTNSNGDGTHQIVLRLPGAAPGERLKAETYGLDEETVGIIVGKLRSALAERAPTARRRRRADLEADLRALAPHGWDLYDKLPGQRTHMFTPLLNNPDAYVVQILRPTSSSFTFPWAFIYEIPLISARPSLCPLVTRWDGQSPLFTGSPRQCPHGPHQEDVLCPFGFWGYRYAIEQLSSTDEVDVVIKAAAPFPFVVAQTQYDVDLQALEAHVATLRGALARAFPGATLEQGKDKSSIRTLLGRDLPFVYFYCHGEKQNDADPDTWLGVGRREALSAKEFKGWIVSWQRGEDRRRVWDKVRPLVFVNACHSLAIYPDTFVSYLDAFVTTAHAAGVIGTEVKVHQCLAMDVAHRFFELLLSRNTVESSLRTVRLEYLADGNLFGLAYTPYCWSELRIN